MYRNILSQARSKSFLIQRTCKGDRSQTACTALTCSHADWGTSGPVPDSHAHTTVRWGVRKHGAPDKPYRFLEAVAQPARSLRVRYELCYTSLSMRRKQYGAGLRTRAANKNCKRHAFCCAQHQVVTLAEPTMHAQTAHKCQNSHFYMWIDILHAEDCLQHILLTHRRHNLDQSILILPRYAGCTTFGFESLGQLKSLHTLHALQWATGQKTKASEVKNRSNELGGTPIEGSRDMRAADESLSLFSHDCGSWMDPWVQRIHRGRGSTLTGKKEDVHLSGSTGVVVLARSTSAGSTPACLFGGSTGAVFWIHLCYFARHNLGPKRSATFGYRCTSLFDVHVITGCEHPLFISFPLSV
jgi:hypothetical protein